jgi:spore germination cell wall hydrolase CwlJ-like protein
MGISKKVIVTLAILATPEVNSHESKFTELECLAKNIYFEGRDQPWVGQVAIAQVTLNRVDSAIFPNNICDVIKQEKRNICQFSWYCDGKSDQPKDLKGYKKATDVAIQVYSGTIPDVTEGALWYHATYIRKPFWAYSFQETVKINEHIFYKRPGR